VLGNVFSSHTILTYRRDTASLRRTLEWLWNVAVEPVLTELGFTETPLHDDKWPHIWWVPVGRLSILPIHAAGYHTTPPRATMERVISSYIPTIRALGYAQGQVDNMQHQSIGAQKFVMVEMSTTPNKLPLPCAANEVNLIESILPPTLQKGKFRMPEKSDVVEELRECSVVHFACHGQVSFNPSQSRLLLSDWETNPLTVADVVRLRLSWHLRLLSDGLEFH